MIHIFNHFNILDFADRPFGSVEEMNETMISRHNSVVTDDDKFYHLGDFGFENKQIRESEYNLKTILSRLNGKRKILIRGNHDPSTKKCYEMGWDEVYNSLQYYPDPENFRRSFLLIHKPQLMIRELVLSGHIHNQAMVTGNNLNMSVEVWNYTPVSTDQIRERIRYLRENVHDTYGQVNLVTKGYEHIFKSTFMAGLGGKY